MPTYQYACTACDHRFDAVQSFSDASLTVCPSCTGALRKVFSSVGIVFKGSGFYRTDSRSGAGSTVATNGSSNGESKSESKGDSTGSEGKSESSSTKKSESTTGSSSSNGSSSSSAPAAAAKS